MDRIVIVTKPTRLEELIGQYMTESAAKFTLEVLGRGRDFATYQIEDATYRSALAEVRRQIPSKVALASVSREELPNFLFRDSDLVLVCGPDGLFVNTAKYISGQVVLTVNPDPGSVDGVLMTYSPREVGRVLAQLKAGTIKTESLPFLRAVIDGEREVWAINDILIGRSDRIGCRHEIAFGGHQEDQLSDGIIVSTGVGSTGWISSVVNMLNGLMNRRGDHKLLSLPNPTSSELVFVVLNPYKAPSTGVSLVTGRITPGNPLKVTSQMPEGGAILSDGVVERPYEWNAGSTVVISVGDRFVQRIVR